MDTGIAAYDISSEDFDRLMAINNSIVVYGRFTYTDPSGHKGETRFCMTHLTNGSIAYCPIPSANYIR